ncbi:MAG: hypothetical protein M1541_14730 [Acidobacteria bacterium]|nr:hypothetical protein [Acidobacteriota bacterium]
MGRPPAGDAAHGEPARIRDYPKLLVTIRPAVKATLKAIVTLQDRPAWKVVEEGIRLCVEQMPPEDRRIIDSIVRRVQK